jgi:hypothetical protein
MMAPVTYMLFHALGTKVSHIFEHEGVVETVEDRAIQVRFFRGLDDSRRPSASSEDSKLVSFEADDLARGDLAILSTVNIRECIRGRFLVHFHHGIGVITSTSTSTNNNSAGTVSVQFHAGGTRVYDENALALGKLTLLHQTKTIPTQSIASAIASIKSSKLAARGAGFSGLAEDTKKQQQQQSSQQHAFTPGTEVSHHFRGDGEVHVVENGVVHVKFKKRGSIHRYNEEKIALGKLRIRSDGDNSAMAMPQRQGELHMQQDTDTSAGLVKDCVL